MKTFKTSDCEIILHDNDLPSDIECGEIISVDTETTGLSLVRDQLCLIQIGISSKKCHMVKFERNFFEKNNSPKNLVKLMKNDNIKKVFHYARFDVAMIKRFFGVYTKNNFCTKIASKLVRTYTDKHGLKDLCKDLLNIDLNKSQQTTDWFSKKLSENQLKYAANDVIHLFDLKKKLEKMLIREKRLELAHKIFNFIPSRVELDLLDWHDIDIFSH